MSMSLSGFLLRIVIIIVTHFYTYDGYIIKAMLLLKWSICITTLYHIKSLVTWLQVQLCYEAIHRNFECMGYSHQEWLSRHTVMSLVVRSGLCEFPSGVGEFLMWHLVEISHAYKSHVPIIDHHSMIIQPSLLPGTLLVIIGLLLVHAIDVKVKKLDSHWAYNLVKLC